jgi:curli biogenesis system outer membrane secretion channel CsgG
VRRLKGAAAAAMLLLPAGCGPGLKVAYNPRTDFSAIRRIGVVTFAGPSGGAAADILTQDLLAAGVQIVERQRLDAVLDEQELARTGVLDPETAVKLRKVLGVDALIVGSVSSYSPGQSYLVQNDGAAVRVGAGVTPVSGRSVHVGGEVWGLPNTQMVSTASTVGLIARMVDVQTGTVLWSARMNYEGFDAETAMSTITEAFVKSLVKVWPALRGAG